VLQSSQRRERFLFSLKRPTGGRSGGWSFFPGESLAIMLSRENLVEIEIRRSNQICRALDQKIGGIFDEA
jgi:hypothetical protein